MNDDIKNIYNVFTSKKHVIHSRTVHVYILLLEKIPI